MLRDELEAMRLNRVRPVPYPGTYAIIKPARMMAQQVTNRDSASWKKAEHIFFDHVLPNKGEDMLPYWRTFSRSNPDGEKSTQSLYVPIGHGEYIKYDVHGQVVAKGKLAKLF